MILEDHVPPGPLVTSDLAVLWLLSLYSPAGFQGRVGLSQSIVWATIRWARSFEMSVSFVVSPSW